MINQHIVQSYNEELNDLKSLVVEMIQTSISQLNSVYESLKDHNVDKASQIISNDKRINELDKKIISMCISILSLRNPLASDLRFVFSASHISRNLERIGDNTRNIAKHISALEEGREKLEVIILNMIHSLLEMLHDMETAFVIQKSDLALAIIEKDLAIDEQYNHISSVAISKIKNVSVHVNTIQSFILMSRYLERIGDHIVNICKNIIFIDTGILE